MKNIKEYQEDKTLKSKQKIWFDIYQFLSPLILTPVSVFLWNKTYSGNLYLVLIAVFIPILYAYIVPGIGTNVLKLWKFDSPLMVGNFRVHHGFIFGSATSVISWIIASGPTNNFADVIISSFVVGSVLALWNTIYDIKAINAGVVKVFNQPYADGKDSNAIVMDYGPVIFGFFGAVYIAGLKVSELIMHTHNITWVQFSLIFICILTLSIVVPVSVFVRSSIKKHGHNGLAPFHKKNK
jgi:hypothetical protein